MVLCNICQQAGYDVEISFWDRGDGKPTIPMEGNGFHSHRGGAANAIPAYKQVPQNTMSATQTATKRKLKPCPSCTIPAQVRWAENGFYPPGHQRAGEKRWKFVNPDGTDHQHNVPWSGNTIENSPQAPGPMTEAQQELQKIHENTLGAIKKQLAAINDKVELVYAEIDRTRKEMVLVANDVVLIKKAVIPTGADKLLNKELDEQPSKEELADADVEEDEQFGVDALDDEIVPHVHDDKYIPENDNSFAPEGN